LLWVIGVARGIDAAIWVSAFLLALSIACWMLGSFSTPVVPRRQRSFVLVLVLLLVLGSVLGLVGFLRITLWSVMSPIYGPHWLLIAITIWLSLIGVVLWGTFAGSMLPIALKRLGLDPAVSSAPFVATLVDVTGIVIYFEVAAYVLRGTLL
jgi:cation transporter-like permease